MVRDFAIRHFGRGGHPEPDAEIIGVLSELADLYDVFYNGQMFLEEDEVRRVRELCVSIGHRMLRLRAWARRCHLHVFQIKPKMHKMQHLGLYSEVFNPRYIQNYMEESLIGTVTRVWQKAMRGNYADFAQSNVLLRRLLAVIFRYE